MRVVSRQREGGVIGGAVGHGHYLNGAPDETDLPDDVARQLIADGVADAVPAAPVEEVAQEAAPVAADEDSTPAGKPGKHASGRR